MEDFGDLILWGVGACGDHDRDKRALLWDPSWEEPWGLILDPWGPQGVWDQIYKYLLGHHVHWDLSQEYLLVGLHGCSPHGLQMETSERHTLDFLDLEQTLRNHYEDHGEDAGLLCVGSQSPAHEGGPSWADSGLWCSQPR